jgi:CRP-like cAMP-binding protein
MSRRNNPIISKFFEDFPSLNYQKNDVIINKKQPIDKIYFIVSGEIIQSGLGSATNRVILNVYKPGSYIPLAYIFKKQPSKYFFIASKTTVCRVAPIDKVAKLIKQDLSVQSDLIKRLTIGIDGLVDKLFIAYTGTAKQKVVLELLIMQARRNNSSGNFEITVTHDDIAEKCGLSRETVTRVLGSLAHKGLIYKKNNKIIILELDGLQKIIS